METNIPMKYYNYIDIPNWIHLQSQLIEFKNQNLWNSKEDLYKDINLKWHCYFTDVVKTKLPDVFYTFKNIGLTIRQLIYFTNLHNDLSVKDSYDSKAVFIHTDAQDNLDARYETDIPILTDFNPTSAINIPLQNYSSSITVFYKRLNDNGDVFYPLYNCGGHNHCDVVEVDRFTLDKPAVLRINVPHGVYNPNLEPRSVATFRFYENLETFFS